MKKSFILVVVLFLIVPNLAYSAETESNLKASISQHKTNIAENAKGLLKYQKKLAALEKKLSTSEEALDAAKQASLLATRQLKINRVPENERHEKRANDLAMLAQRKVSLDQKRKDLVLTKIDELKKDSQASKKAIRLSESALEKLKSRAQQISNSVASPPKPLQTPAVALVVTKTIRTPEPKPEVPADIRVSKNRAPLNPNPLVASVSKPRPRTTKIEPTKAPRPVPAVVNRKPSPSPTVAAASISSSTSQGTEEQQLIKKRLKQIQDYIASLTPQTDKKFKRIRGSSNRGDKLKFAHIGGNIYKAEQRMNAGKHRITVDFSTFELRVPEPNNGKMYTFYFDNRDKKRRKLIRFATDLIN